MALQEDALRDDGTRANGQRRALHTAQVMFELPQSTAGRCPGLQGREEGHTADTKMGSE